MPGLRVKIRADSTRLLPGSDQHFEGKRHCVKAGPHQARNVRVVPTQFNSGVEEQTTFPAIVVFRDVNEQHAKYSHHISVATSPLE